MRFYFCGSRALVRVLAAGRTAWCVETGEGWQCEGGASLNHARRFARLILAPEEGRKTFFFVSGEK